ncbi:tumor necrosis factor receptor superfamily member 5 [Tachyglossus aculeatus]|uniref:tumor necrosis factor receptor superfamily member 5 n=1 Tax=Tachyglossus aculeatus TaxID=9261 RepID=UPI0018F398CD|nr:tumor necrosis factor receptor superfamily member 5 [Tachyglossus aculeatus]
MAPLPLRCLLWIYAIVAAQGERRTSCNKETHYEFGDSCCQLCPAGTKMVAGCGEDGGPSRCQPCGEGEFQPRPNHDPHCRPHKFCNQNAGFVELAQATEEKDTRCVCQPGMHCSGSMCETCAPHTPCSLGFGVVQAGTPNSDTVCAPCERGFSNVSSTSEPCRPWTSCGATGLPEMSAGTDTADALCGPSPVPTGPKSRETLAVLLPVVAGVVFAVVCALCWTASCSRRKIQKQKLKQVELEEGVLPHAGPQEVEDPFPIQETGKESHISEQERQ